MIKAYAYIRFSSIQQSKGNSLARQMKLTNDFVSKHGLLLDDTLSMRDLGISAYKRKNITKGALGAFIKAVETGIVEKGSFLLVESLDRISRAEITEQMQLFLTLINADITIVTLLDGFIYKKETIDRQMSDLSYSLMIMSRGHEESKTKSKRVLEAWEEKRKDIENHIYTSLRPAWLDIDKDKNSFIANEEKSTVVKKIFEMAEKGLGKDRITKYLNKEGIKTFGRSKNWQQSYIQKILQNRSVIGEFQPHKMENGKRVPVGNPIIDYFPKIITDEQFYNVVNRRKSMAKFGGRARSSNRNLFTGLLKCGYTGCSVVFVNKGKWKYLVSSDARLGKKELPYVSWVYKDFETSFFEFVKELKVSDIINPEWRDKSSEIQSEIKKIEYKIEKINRNIKILVDSILEGKAPHSIKDRIVDLEKDLEEQNAQLSNQNNELINHFQIEKDIEKSQAKSENIFSKIDDLEFREELKLIIQEQISRIDVYAGGPPINNNQLGGMDLFFESWPVLSDSERVQLKENKNKKMLNEIGDALVARVNDRLKYNEDEDEDEVKIFPTDKKKKYFKVKFKTGILMYVMPNPDNPKQFKKRFSINLKDFKHGSELIMEL